MKRQTILLLLSVLLLSGGAAAQSTKEQTLEDLNRTAALYYCYENHPRAAATPAPEGYEPFYISHYGRHGSRWHASESVYENPRAKLRKAAEAGKLTPLGEEALRRIEVVADDARHRYGDLSPRGVREHRGIAERMYCSFPEIFSTADGRLCRIRARSTLVPRCMLSMAAANERLKELNPAIDITREASKRYLDYMFRMTEANKIKKEIKQRIAELREREIDPSRFVRALVTDPSLVGNRKEQLRFMNDLYCVASVMQDVDYLDCSFYDLFTPDELYAFYAVRNYQMYLEEGPSAEFGHRALSDAVPLLRNFVAEADEAIATGALSASLRYGHDVNVIPLVGLMGIEGCDTRESDYRKVDQAWSCWRVTPMATNIQLVFFRRPDGGDVLVKFLFNERESRIRLESDLAPYYRWDDVKRYFDERIATQTRRSATLLTPSFDCTAARIPEAAGKDGIRKFRHRDEYATRLPDRSAALPVRSDTTHPQGSRNDRYHPPANRHTASYPAQRAPRPAPPAVAVRFASTTSFLCRRNIPRDVYDLL